MSEDELEFPEAPLSPSLPSDFLEPSIESEPERHRSPRKIRALPKNSLPSRQSTTNNNVPLSESKASTHTQSNEGSPKPASRQSSRGESKLSPEDERKCKALGQEMALWVERARSKKHESDRARKERKHRLACVLALDSVVCFMIGFDFEDRIEAIRTGPQVNGTPSHVRSWNTLIPYLAELAVFAESVDADLAGVFYQVCAVIRLHIIYVRRRTVPPEESARALYAALADFRRGLALLPLSITQSRYSMNEANGWLKTRIEERKPDPINNTATLPLHVNSSLAEAAAFALTLGIKWARMEKLEYSWESSKT